MLRCQFLRHVLKASFFIKIAIKLSYFCKKMQNFRALGAEPLNPRASGGCGLCPQTPKTAPPLRVSGYAPAPVIVPWALLLTNQKITFCITILFIMRTLVFLRLKKQSKLIGIFAFICNTKAGPTRGLGRGANGPRGPLALGGSEKGPWASEAPSK